MTLHQNLTGGIAQFGGLGRCLREWGLCAVLL